MGLFRSSAVWYGMGAIAVVGLIVLMLPSEYQKGVLAFLGSIGLICMIAKERMQVRFSDTLEDFFSGGLLAACLLIFMMLASAVK